MKLTGQAASTHPCLGQAEQSSGPCYPLLHVTHGWTWELGLSFRFCFLVTIPWASSQTCPCSCPPVLSQAGRGSPWHVCGRPRRGCQDLGQGPFRSTSLQKEWGSCAQVWMVEAVPSNSGKWGLSPCGCEEANF